MSTTQSCGTSGSMASLSVSCPRGGNLSPPVWQVCRVKTNNRDTTPSSCELYLQFQYKTGSRQLEWPHVKECPRWPALELCCLCVQSVALSAPRACAAVCHQTHESITRNAHNFTPTRDLCELFICVPLANNSIPWQSCAQDVWSSKSRVSGEVVVNKHQSSCTLACRPCLWRSNRTTVAPTGITFVSF